MSDQERTPHSLRALLYLGLVGISLVFALTGYGLRRYVESHLAMQAEAQVRALSRHRAQQSLLVALLDEEVGLRGFMATGDSRLLGSYYQGTKAEADAIRNTLDNLDPADQEEAQPKIERLQKMVSSWHEEVADPMVRQRSAASLPNLKEVLEKEKKHFEAVREASESLLRLLDDRDNVRLVAVEESLETARWISSAAMLLVFFLGLWVSRLILRKVADPLVELAEAARLGAGFPDPDSIHSVREVEVLSQALFELDGRVREREQSLRQGQEEAQAVRDFTELVQRIDLESDLLAATEQALRRFVQADRVQIFLRPPVGDGLEARVPVLSPGEAERHRILQDAMACRAIQKGAPVMLGADAPTACLCPLGNPGKGGYLCIPLVASGQLMGVVNLQASKAGHCHVVRQRIAEACVSVAAAALQALRALALAKEQAIRDGLTGAFNRRFLDEILAKVVDQGRRREQPLSALMIDIDHFKRFNDQYGHDAGDQVLRSFSRCLHEQVRAGDVVVRYGGEEFVVMLPFTSYEVALSLAERIRLRVEVLPLPEPEFPKGCRVTASLGVATFPEHGQDGEELLAAADKALYGAKGGGRNRVVGFRDIGL